jgi:GntR family transcriptional regulator/MocR family aminotransferase
LARWKLELLLDPTAELPLFVQIARAIADAVRTGRLKPGASLPGTRSLAGSLQVNRNTVVAAFGELLAEGWITSERGRGTFVSSALPEPAPPPRSSTGKGTRAVVGFELSPEQTSTHIDEAVPEGKTKWDFGLPDVRLAPTRELARAFRRAVQDPSGRLLQYSRYRVDPWSRLQTSLASMLSATRGLRVDPEQLVLTRGSQMALYLVARTLIRPGDVVAVENPGYYLSWTTFASMGARLQPIGVDAAGLKVAELEALVKGGRRLRAIFVTPHHQFPTTVPLSPGRRVELLRFARAHRVAIIEDDYDHEFNYQGRPLLPLASASDDGLVAYIGSLSKIVAPGVRVGYLVAPEPLVRRVLSLRRLIDDQGDPALDAALAELFEEGEMQRHINRARKVYRVRRDCLVEALKTQLSDELSFSVPKGGLAIWARVSPGLEVERWAARALSAGLQIRTGRLFYLDAKPRQFLRLGFARMNEGELEAAVRRLVKAR